MKKNTNHILITAFRIAFGLIYFFIICPLGLFYKILKIDPLQKKLDKTKTSYWEDQTYEGKNTKTS